MSRAQLLDDDGEQSLPSDSEDGGSELDNESHTSREDESDTTESSSQLEPQPDVAQAVNQTRQEDRKKGLAVSRQLVRPVYLFNNNRLTL